MSRILYRYVLREFLIPVSYCFIAFASLHLIFELFGEFDKILQSKPSVFVILRYIGGFLAKDLQWLITPSLLLGGLYAMWQLARNSEITARRASGIGFSMITAPLLMAAIVFAVLTFLCSEYYAPKAIFDSILIKNSDFSKCSDKIYENVPYNNARDRRDWQIGTFDSGLNKLENIKITWTDHLGHKEHTLDAKSAQYLDGIWWFEEVVDTKYSHTADMSASEPVSSTTREVLVMPELDERPRDFIIEQNLQGINPEIETLSIRDMRAYVAQRPNLTDKARHTWNYEIANRFAAPLACIFITLFAVPAGVATGRQSVFAGVVMAILLFIGYYAVSLFCGVQAKSGTIPIWFGITFPNVAIFSAGLYLYKKQQ